MSSEERNRFRNLVFPPSKKFDNPYRGQIGDRNLELRTFASSMGQMTENIALQILSSNVELPQKTIKKLEELYKCVRNPLLERVKKIPTTTVPANPEKGTPKRKATFSHKKLFPAYMSMFKDEDWSDRFKGLAVATDQVFGSEIVKKMSVIGGQNKWSELDPPEDFSEIRYGVDAVLMSWHLFFDKDTRNMLARLGQLVPDINLPLTQIDGMFINPMFNIEGMRNGAKVDNENLLHTLSRKPGIAKFSKTVPAVVDCNLLEIKSIFSAREVAGHPIRKTPRSWHIAQMFGSINTVLNNYQVGIAPERLALLYLNPLQPNAVHIIKADSFYWQNLANKVERAILYDLTDSFEDEIMRDSLSKFLDFTTLMAQEQRVVENKDKTREKHRKKRVEKMKIGGQKKLKSLDSEDWGKLPVKTPEIKTKKKVAKNSNPKLF